MYNIVELLIFFKETVMISWKLCIQAYCQRDLRHIVYEVLFMHYTKNTTIQTVNPK